MTTLLVLSTPTPDAVGRLVALLERHRHTSPQLEEELARQQTLTHTLAEHRLRGDRALSAWRTALSRRWECEVSAQRAYRSVQRQLGDYYGPDTVYAQLIAPAHPSGSGTASDLLHELRRLAASLELLAPCPPFAAEALARLHVTGDELAVAIEQSQRCENERRSVSIEQRMAVNLYGRAYERARRLLAGYIGEQALGLPPSCPERDELPG